MRFTYRIEHDSSATDPREHDHYSPAEVTAWKNGLCFGFVITCEGFGVVDSCWGYYDYAFCKENAKEALKNIDKEVVISQIKDAVEGLNDIIFELEGAL